MAEVRVPRDTVNDDVVTLVTWHRAAGESVRKGEKLLSVETSKALIDVDAEADGTLHILRPGGEQVPVGDLVGHILALGEALPVDVSPAKTPTPASTSAAPAPASASAAPAPAPPRAPAAGTGPANGAASAAAAASAAKPSGPVFSKRAEALVAERGLDRALFEAMGLVREEDVRRMIDDGASAQEPEPPPVSAPEPARPAASGAVPAPASRGGVFGDALRAAGDRGVPLPELVFNYVVRNWLLGNLVKVAPRGVDLALHRMRGVKIGRDVFVDPTAILETAYPEMLTIGDDARIAARAIVMCHIKAPNHLRETGLVPQVKRPVVLSESCFVGVGAVILPGVTVGRGAVVASGSVVVADVPPYTLVSGNPAKVVKRFPVPEAHR